MIPRSASILLLLATAVASPVRAQSSRPASRSAATQPAGAQAGEDILAPTRINLHLKNVTARQAYDALAKAMGLSFRPNPANLYDTHQEIIPRIDLDHVSFWEAGNVLAEKTGVALRMVGMSRDLVVASGTEPFWRGNAVESGAFLAVANSIYYASSVDMNAGGAVQRNCSVRVTLYSEPKVQVLKGAFQASVDRAIDENGKELPAAPLPAALVGRAGMRMQPATAAAWPMQLQLVPPVNAGQKIALLKGHVDLVVQTRSESVEIPNVMGAQNVSRKLGNYKLTLKTVKKNANNLYTVMVTLEREGDGPKGAEWSDINLSNTVRLVDANDQPLSRRTFGMASSSAAKVDLNLMFSTADWQGGPGSGDPTKLIWEMPVECRSVTVPFEFHDLPLP